MCIDHYALLKVEAEVEAAYPQAATPAAASGPIVRKSEPNLCKLKFLGKHLARHTYYKYYTCTYVSVCVLHNCFNGSLE